MKRFLIAFFIVMYHFAIFSEEIVDEEEKEEEFIEKAIGKIDCFHSPIPQYTLKAFLNPFSGILLPKRDLELPYVSSHGQCNRLQAF